MPSLRDFAEAVSSTLGLVSAPLAESFPEAVPRVLFASILAVVLCAFLRLIIYINIQRRRRQAIELSEAHRREVQGHRCFKIYVLPNV